MPDAVTVASMPKPRTAAASSVCALSSGGGSASAVDTGAAPRAGGGGAPTLSRSGAAVAATSFSLSCGWRGRARSAGFQHSRVGWKGFASDATTVTAGALRQLVCCSIGVTAPPRAARRCVTFSASPHREHASDVGARLQPSREAPAGSDDPPRTTGILSVCPRPSGTVTPRITGTLEACRARPQPGQEARAQRRSTPATASLVSLRTRLQPGQEAPARGGDGGQRVAPALELLQLRDGLAARMLLVRQAAAHERVAAGRALAEARRRGRLEVRQRHQADLRRRVARPGPTTGTALNSTWQRLLPIQCACRHQHARHLAQGASADVRRAGGAWIDSTQGRQRHGGVKQAREVSVAARRGTR